MTELNAALCLVKNLYVSHTIKQYKKKQPHITFIFRSSLLYYKILIHTYKYIYIYVALVEASRTQTPERRVPEVRTVRAQRCYVGQFALYKGCK